MRSGELTKAEKEHIAAYHTCPDCGVGDLWKGPRASLSLNVKCSNIKCRQEFCLGIWQKVVIHGERIDRDEPRLYKKSALFK